MRTLRVAGQWRPPRGRASHDIGRESQGVSFKSPTVLHGSAAVVRAARAEGTSDVAGAHEQWQHQLVGAPDGRLSAHAQGARQIVRNSKQLPRR